MSDSRRAAPIDWSALKERLARAGEAIRAGGRRSGEAARAELVARARTLARSAPTAPPAGTVTSVVFALGAERYAVETTAVREVVRVPAVARLPGAPPFLVGLANLRGEVVDVVDVRAFLGAGRPDASAADTRRLIVLGADDAELAVLVDDVEGLAEVSFPRLVPPPESAARTRPEYVRGVDPVVGAALLDAGALLQDPRLVVDEEAPHAPPTEVT